MVKSTCRDCGIEFEYDGDLRHKCSDCGWIFCKKCVHLIEHTGERVCNRCFAEGLNERY